MTLKIMPLGDSNTRGMSWDPAGYRNDLWTRLVLNGYDVDFVGTQSAGSDGMDVNHEGHGGWTIQDIYNSVNGWLNTHQPDVIMLMIGTNDVLKETQPMTTAPDRLSALIDRITNTLPNAQVLVGTILPLDNTLTNRQQAIDFNSEVPGIVSAKAAAGKKVSFVDVFNQISYSDLSTDAIHLSVGGYEKLAHVWYNALLNFTEISNYQGTPPFIRREAENMSLSGSYQIEQNVGPASNSRVVRASGTTPGTASTTFSGPSGTYDIVVAYFDENDGNAQFSANIAGTTSNWTANQNLGSSSVSTQNLVRRTIATSTTLTQGAPISVTGTASGGESARFDYIEFIPRSGSGGTPTPTPTPTPTTLRVEAETLSLTGYSLESRSIASNGQMIAIPNNGTTVGNATGIFTGVSGTYNIVVSYVDENDGSSPYRFSVNGSQVAQWIANQNLGNGGVIEQTRVTRTVATEVTLQNGVQFAIAGERNSAEFARVDYIEFVPVSATPEPTPTPTPEPTLTPLVVEAESLSLTNYRTENSNVASGGQLITLLNTGSTTGTASGTFTGANGTYEIVVKYFDENDGQSPLSFSLNGTQLSQWIANQNLGNGGVVAQTLTHRTVGTSVSLQSGAQFSVSGAVNGSEFARIDSIEFIPISLEPSPSLTLTLEPAKEVNIEGTDQADSLTGNSLDNVIRGFAGNDTLTGEPGSDRIVLASTEGTDFITDFTVGEDVLVLREPLNYQGLTILRGEGTNSGNALITLMGTGEVLAILSEVEATSITNTSFILLSSGL